MTQPGSGMKKDLTAEQLEELRDWIHRHSGIFLDSSRLDPLRISVVARASRLEFADHADYFELLKRDESEFKELLNLVTINETSFFRFPGQFEALSHSVVPEIIEGKSKMNHSFRAWSAGCSTGEEPYSIAMSLLESPHLAAGFAPEVLGTDVSTQALDRAREGVYRAKALANLPQQTVQKWFEPAPGGHRPIAAVRNLVEFSYHNLIKEPYPLSLIGNWDVIFCRNVTIYFKFDSTRRVVSNFYDALNPGGYLFIGHSESLTAISDRFETVDVGGVFLYRKPRPRRFTTFDEVLAERQRSGRGRGAGAIQADSGAAAEDLDSVAGFVGEAYRLLDSGRPIEAREAADEALALEPSSVEALIVRAYTHADDGDMDAAIDSARRVIEVDPFSASAHYILGLIYQRQGEQDAALEEFQRTVSVDDGFVLAHFNLANLYKSHGALDEACREYRNTLAALETSAGGSWTAFLGGFQPDLLAQTCRRSLVECDKGPSRS
jgi:chemotaxis protein methyltransferase CheR